MTSLGLFFSVNESSYVSLIANRCSLSDALKQLECNGVFPRWGMSPLTWVKAQQQQQQQYRAATSALFAFPSWLLSVASDSSSGWTSASRAQWKELPGTAAPLGHIDPLLCPLNEPLFALFRASHRLQNRHNDDSNTVYKAAGDSFSFSLCFLVSLLSLPHSAFQVTVQTLRHVISDIFTKKGEDRIQKNQCDMFSCWLRCENEMLF